MITKQNEYQYKSQNVAFLITVEIIEEYRRERESKSERWSFVSTLFIDVFSSLQM